MMIQGDDGYDERSVLADHGVCQRLSLVCAAASGELNGFSTVFHWFVQLHLVGR